MLVQKQDINCELMIKNGYHNIGTRHLRLKDTCIHCYALGVSDYLSLFGTKELRMMNKFSGFECRPICKDCLCRREMIATKGGKDIHQERREKDSTRNQKQSKK